MSSILPLLIACCLSGESIAKRDSLAMKLDNAQVEWDGTFVGLTPRLTEDTGKVATVATKADIHLLIAALHDKQRYVAAHVLLVKLTGIEGVQNGHSWYGLEVQLQGNGNVRYDKDAQAKLVASWGKWKAKRDGKP